MRAERDCFPLYPVYPTWPILSKLPTADNGKPAYIQLQNTLTNSLMLRRLWEHWCHMEAILTWTEVSPDEIERFIECTYASLSATSYHTSFPFPLPDSRYDTLSQLGLSSQVHADAMSTACNYFTAPPGDIAQKWIGAITHQALLRALLRARQEHTTWLVTPMLQDNTISAIVSTAATLSSPKQTPTEFDHSA